ncbi:TasA family protein [Peribacillus acanthi]|uniref:TasA family protein n=1 Tax=Peribacillus acanthi TaxID=2171554 RepID=UPI000D3E7277|nr:TasA family protein [Peribacillus acanthi]
MGIKKRAGLAMGTMALAAALVGGGTYALFSDTVTNAGNTFTAGTVEITDMTGGKVFASSLLVGNLAPGDTETKTVTVKNDGNLEIWVAIDNTASDATKLGDLFGGGTPLSVTYDTAVKKLAPGASTTFNVTYNLPLAADNSYQGDTGKFDVVVKAVQVRNNDNGTGPNAWN